MVGFWTMILALVPFGLSVFLARFVADTDKDAGMILVIGIVGAVSVVVYAILCWCVKKRDGEDTAT